MSFVYPLGLFPPSISHLTLQARLPSPTPILIAISPTLRLQYNALGRVCTMPSLGGRRIRAAPVSPAVLLSNPYLRLRLQAPTSFICFLFSAAHCSLASLIDSSLTSPPARSPYPPVTEYLRFALEPVLAVDLPLRRVFSAFSFSVRVWRRISFLTVYCRRFAFFFFRDVASALII